MFNNRGGRKRELSIYSILTIIVIISISGGCVSRERTITGEHACEAGLLVTAKNIIVGSGNEGYERWWGEDTTREIRYIQQSKSSFSDTALWIDGRAVHGWTDRTSRDAWVEIAPGRHKYSYNTTLVGWYRLASDQREHPRTFKAYSGRSTDGWINVNPHDVFVLIDQNQGQDWPEGRASKTQNDEWQAMIIKVPHKYSQTTGFATHPTNSKLSFK